MDYEFLYSFTERILASHESICWVGITNKYSVLLATEQRPDNNAFLTNEENEEFSSTSITRHRKNTKLAPKIGKVKYAFGRYRNFCRATIPINEDYYLLLMLDSESKGFNDLITVKIMPMIENEKSRFVAPSD